MASAMQRYLRFLVRGLGLALLLPSYAAFAADGRGAPAAPTGRPLQLRGFGELVFTPLTVGSLSGWQWQCENADHATVFLHKLGRDLAQSGTVAATWQTVAVGGVAVQVLVRPGLGSFLPLAKDKTVLVFCTPQTDNLAAAFADSATALAGARFFDPAFRYPVYLDKFSHNGIGTWYPQYWGDANTKGKPNTVDDHFAYARQHDLPIQPNSGGYLLRNILPKLHEYGRPYHFAQWQEWSQDLARLAPEELVMPGALFTTMPWYYGQISDGGRRLLQYRDWCFQNVVKELKDDPLLVDWLDPNGEVGPMPFFTYWDFSEGNRQNLIRYLKTARNYTPQTLGEAWFGDKSHFKNWETVPIPMNYEIFGWRAGDPQADPVWRVHPASADMGAQSAKPWYEWVSECPATVRDGVDKGYHRENFNDTGWAAFEMPGGELPAIYWGTKQKQFWHRGSLAVTPKWLAQAKKGGRINLTVAALVGSRGWKNPDRLWVNGIEMAPLSAGISAELIVQVDVTSVIKAGRNTLVYLPATPSAGLGGPFFLTTRPLEQFPFSDTRLNARYRDWLDYISWCVIEKMENTFKAIRAVDPDRFIKMHAAEDKHLGIPLQAKYGCFGHNTGEGGFFRPWDKRFGYPYGVPTSAEFGGPVETIPGLKRWIGWYTFEGLNAFDQFHNIQGMMYAANKDVWVEFMPYLKLAPRRDLKRPDIALLWSSHNNQFLPRPVPYCFDLGRGDLQFIGYSYVDVNESTIRDGLVKDYPVIWDTGTWIMDPETVQQLKAYVEAGGTFVALQETGRHTYTQRDAWPIRDLTGYQVREIRPMTGTLSILVEQPLFKKLAGKPFYNRGKSVDFSDYNYADKCVALEPLVDGTTPIARYGDGAIAIGLRKLGKGRVITLGSPFWRDSYDGAGMWWPGESQCQFLEDLLAGLGLQPLAKSSSHDIWREHYLATNGTEEFLALFNPFDTPRDFSIEWTTMKPAGALFDPKNGQTIAGKVEDNKVTLDKVTLAGLETRIVATQVIRPPAEAVRAWFDQLSWWWRASAPGEALTRPDLPVYTISLAGTMTGKIVTGAAAATVDPAAVSRTSSPGPDWTRWAGQSVEEFKSKPDPARRVFLHGPIVLPQSWKPTDRIELVVSTMNHVVPDMVGPVDAWLNGQPVLKQQKCAARGYSELEDGFVIEVTGILQFGADNALCLAVGSNGFIGEVKLRCRPVAVAEIDITGTFKTQVDADAGLGTAMVPGTMKALYAWKDDIVVPAAWRNSRVFITLDLAKLEEFDSFAINGKVVFHPVNWYKAVTWMDITPWLRWDAPNRLTLITKAATQRWEPGNLTVKRISLQQVK